MVRRGERDCFYCLDGYVFLGRVVESEHALDSEVIEHECVQYRKCGGTGILAEA